MKDTVSTSEQITKKEKSPILEKIGNFLFGLFVTFLFTLPVWCILMIVVYFVGRL